jgi:glutamate 5-kinase
MKRRIVVKVGSSTLTGGGGGGLDRDYVRALVDQLAWLKAEGDEPVLVSSGAIAAGVSRLGLNQRPTDMPSLQAAASVGQVALIEMYAALFASHGITVGQVLVTRHDTGHRESFLHARDTFERLLNLGALPIVNENDTVAVDEIRFGDNDTLAALVGTMVRADLVVLLSDTEGLYDADPRLVETAQLLETVDEVTDDLLEAAGGSGSDHGSGGMVTKLEAARVLMRAGIPMVVCDGSRAGVIRDAVEGRQAGTVFEPGEGSLGARKSWIALGRKAAGAVMIDEGASSALRHRKTSLLPAGVTAVEGTFGAGDTIVLRDESQRLVGQGLSGLSSDEIALVKGLTSVEIAQRYPGLEGKEVVHRDHLVVL